MPTPLYSALCELAAAQTKRFHMPGHKGMPVFDAFSGVFPLDFTETYGTGNLYQAAGPIRDAEILAAACYGAADCLFLTSGSSQGVHAMLAYSCPPGSTVLIDRNCHQSVCYALALLGLTPRFLYPETREPFGIPGQLDPAEVEAVLEATPQAVALLITSPNYYGLRQDIPALADLCRRYGKKLLVDSAHAAHFPALGIPSAIQEGVDLAVISAHKTLPCLGQGALLLAGSSVDYSKLRECTRLCGTSSPSYAIMASMDLARDWLMQEGGDAYRRAAHNCNTLRANLRMRTPFLPLNGDLTDPCRLTISTAGTDLTGFSLSDALYARHGIACEMADSRNIVLIVSGTDSSALLDAVLRALVLEGQAASPRFLPLPLPPMPHARRSVEIREAWFAPHENAPLRACAGRICARPVTPYPPGVPLIYPGEEITVNHIEYLTKICYHIEEQISVLYK